MSAPGFDLNTTYNADGSAEHRTHFFQRVRPGCWAKIIERADKERGCEIVYQRLCAAGRRYSWAPNFDEALRMLNAWVKRNAKVLTALTPEELARALR